MRDQQPVDTQADATDCASWLDSDPWIEQGTLPHPNDQQYTGQPDFFQLGHILGPQESQPQHSRLLKGVGIISKLTDPQYTAAEEYLEPDTVWLARMLASAPDPDHFQAGRMHAHVDVLDAFFTQTGSNNPNSRKIRTWVRHGIKLPFVGVGHKSHAQAAHYDRNLQVVKRMLSRSVGEANISPLLEGSKPSAVQFQNHKSVQTYAAFVDSELAKALAKGVIAEWPFADPPTVVSGLKVVDDKLPKLRLCINPMYINLFLRYEPLQYEKLLDLTHIIQQGDYMSTSDDKSGYWQLDMHPSMWQFIGFQYKGAFYCFKVLPFGISIACWVYSIIKQELFRPLRKAGARLQYLIDDR